MCIRDRRTRDSSPVLGMTNMLIDTHAHLDFPDFANDLEDVLRRAEEADVKHVITIGTSIEGSRRAIELAEKYPSVYAAIGVHPSYAEEAEDDVITPCLLYTSD